MGSILVLLIVAGAVALIYKMVNHKEVAPEQVAEPAKALMWILNIWNSRLTCASEIEGDDKTVLNGNLIKRIVSGGDSIEARGNYMNEVEIVPAFTPWFMYNQWYDVEPIDACENLIQFICPSKFLKLIN